MNPPRNFTPDFAAITLQSDALAQTIDQCVRMVTACGSLTDLQDTQPSYAPTIYARTFTHVEKVAAHRVVAAFNAWASRPENGRQRLAEVVL